MKKAIIDIGSNSVRLAIFADGIVILRDKLTTQLGEGMALNGNLLKKEAIARTVDAVERFVRKSLASGVEKENVFAFATAAVRNSLNGKIFIDSVKRTVNQSVDVLSGEVEGEIAMLGALGGADGACIDVGGASSELVVAQNGKITYSHSLKLGAVLLRDLYKEDRKKLEKAIDEAVGEYGNVKINKLIAIGGTSSACAFLSAKLTVFEREITNGRYIGYDELGEIVDELFKLTVKERVENLKLSEKRADVICGGALLLLKVMKKFGLSGLTVSENDNLEGYYAYLEGKRYEK